MSYREWGHSRGGRDGRTRAVRDGGDGRTRRYDRDDRGCKEGDGNAGGDEWGVSRKLTDTALQPSTPKRAPSTPIMERMVAALNPAGGIPGLPGTWPLCGLAMLHAAAAAAAGAAAAAAVTAPPAAAGVGISGEGCAGDGGGARGYAGSAGERGEEKAEGGAESFAWKARLWRGDRPWWGAGGGVSEQEGVSGGEARMWGEEERTRGEERTWGEEEVEAGRCGGGCGARGGERNKVGATRRVWALLLWLAVGVAARAGEDGL
ncbi:unnamed protein product [Closterium sp. Naga37s-1]|nr:unnamed protein product [Closterium sp. Naga37s-1]